MSDGSMLRFSSIHLIHCIKSKASTNAGPVRSMKLKQISSSGVIKCNEYKTHTHMISNLLMFNIIHDGLNQCSCNKKRD